MQGVANLNGFVRAGNNKGKVQTRLSAAGESKTLTLVGEACNFNFDGVAAERHVVETKLAGVIARDCLRPIGILRRQGDLGTLHGTMLWIVNQSGDRTENRGAEAGGK